MIFGAVMWFVLADALLAWKDRTLVMRASRVEGLLSSLPDQRIDMLTLRLDELVGILPEGQLIQISRSDGTILFPTSASPSTTAFASLPCATPFMRTIRLGRDEYRQLCHPVTYGGAPAYLKASSTMLEDQILLDTFTSALYKMVPVILLVSCVGGYVLGRRALRPVNSLIAEAQKISTSDLSRRLPVPTTNDELRQLAIEWNSLLARIQTTLARITQFTADASHELRNPIAYIRTTAEYSLENPGLDGETREALLEIVDETRSTSELLDNLLTLARADGGHVFDDSEESEVEPIIHETCARFAQLARAKQQNLYWKISDDASPALRMNSFHLRRLLTVLLDNAIKFTGTGGNIFVHYDTISGAQLRVTDDGIGIGADELPKVFDRFYRVDAARSDTRDGVGLGLSIAKWIAELYRGDITIESEAAKGTVVTFHLPSPAVLDGSKILFRS